MGIASSTLIRLVDYGTFALAALLAYRTYAAYVPAVDVVAEDIDADSFMAQLSRRTLDFTGTAMVIIRLEVGAMAIAALVREFAVPIAFAAVSVVKFEVAAFSMAFLAMAVALAFAINAPFVLIAVGGLGTRSVLAVAI